MRFAVLHERNLHIEQSSFSQVVQPMCVHVSKKMRNEKRKNIETKDERNGARPFSYHITSSSIYLSLDTHSPYLTPSKKKLFKQTEKKRQNLVDFHGNYI